MNPQRETVGHTITLNIVIHNGDLSGGGGTEIHVPVKKEEQ